MFGVPRRPPAVVLVTGSFNGDRAAGHHPWRVAHDHRRRGHMPEVSDSPGAGAPTPPELRELQVFVVRLGAAMNAAGSTVYEVQERLARRLGQRDPKGVFDAVAVAALLYAETVAMATVSAYKTRSGAGGVDDHACF
jgi:hypothetical protein